MGIQSRDESLPQKVGSHDEETPTEVMDRRDPQRSNHPQGKSRKRLLAEHGGLSARGNYNFGIPTKKGAQDHIEEYHGTGSWRMSVLQFLHQPKVQRTLMILLLLDVIILFVELFLMTQYPMCNIIERDCISCCPPNDLLNETNDLNRILKGGDEGHDNVCNSELEPNYDTGGCDTHKWEVIHNVETAMFGLTIAILSTFFVELHIEMIALHPNVFFLQFFYALDYVIVTVSLIVELTLHFLHEDNLAALVGVFIFARIWRFIRIGHGIVEVTSEMTHQKYDKLLDYTGKLEEAAKQAEVAMPNCPHSVEKALKKHQSDSQHNSSSDRSTSNSS